MKYRLVNSHGSYFCCLEHDPAEVIVSDKEHAKHYWRIRDVLAMTAFIWENFGESFGLEREKQ